MSVQIVRSVHFAAAPSSDLMVSGCRDKAVRVFSSSLQTMDPLVQFTGLRDPVHSVKFFNDDKELLVAYSDAPGLSVLDVRTGTAPETFFSSFCFIPDHCVRPHSDSFPPPVCCAKAVSKKVPCTFFCVKKGTRRYTLVAIAELSILAVEIASGLLRVPECEHVY